MDINPTPQRDKPMGSGLLWILFSFEGRIPRRVFWAARIGSMMAFYAAIIVLSLVFGDESSAVTIPVLILYIPLAWTTLAVSAKRWHDVDKSGWWFLITLIPLIGPIWAFVENGCLRGTIGRNQYGPDPT